RAGARRRRRPRHRQPRFAPPRVSPDLGSIIARPFVSSASLAPPTAMKHQKILIADDDAKARLPLSAILEAEGYEVDAVDDGQKALDILADGSYGVVLADLKMPKVDGIALLKAMRERQIPTEFVMITGEGNTDVAVDAIKQGATDYIEKPLTAERLSKLKAQIPKLLQQFALQQKNRELETRLEGLTHYGELVGQS